MKTSEVKDVKNPPDDVRQDIVKIIVNDVAYEIHRGHQTVSEIKKVGNVPQAHTLVQIEGSILKPLSDDGAVVIKGGEEFKSHPKDGGNS